MSAHDFTTEELKNFGVTSDTLEEIEYHGYRFIKVHVCEPCTCKNCNAGKCWFFCEDKLLQPIATFACIGDGANPFSDHIKAIKKEFPKHTLIY